MGNSFHRLEQVSEARDLFHQLLEHNRNKLTKRKSRLVSNTGSLSYHAGSISESLVGKEPNGICAHIKFNLISGLH